MTTPAIAGAAPLEALPAAAHASSAWQLGWRQLLRDFRAGELRLLVVAVTLAVAALTAVGFFADRINGGLARDARQLLGGDAVVVERPAGAASLRRQGARARPARRRTANFPSMGARRDAQGRRDAAGQRQGGERRLSAARQARACAAARATKAADVAAGAGARARSGSTPALLDALGLPVGDPLLLGDAQPDGSTRVIVHRARPRRRLRELRAARDAQRRPTCRRPAWCSRRAAIALSPRGRGRRRDDAKVGGVRRLGRGTRSRAKSLRGVRIESLASRPARDAPDARPRREVPQPGRAARGAARRGRGRHRRARLRRPPSRRLRDAARARPAAAHDRAAVPRRVRAGRPGRERRRAASSASPSTTSSSGCSPAWSRRCCRRRASGRRCSAPASASRCCSASACRRCCSSRACRRCA